MQPLVVEPQLADRIVSRVAGCQVVQERASRPERAGRGSPRAPSPCRRPRRGDRTAPRRQHLTPVAVKHRRVLVAGEQLGRGGRALSVELDGHERHLRVERGEDPGRADAAAGADLGDARAAALAREHLEQPAGLGAAGLREARTLGERERSLDERRKHVPTLTRMSDQLPLPPHWDPDRVGEVWRVDYAERFADAERWREQHGVATAADDRFRVALVVVDVQNTFCTPGFELFVAGRSGTGALDDSRRLCEFVYRNLGSLTQIVPTLDTHQALQIFHRILLVDEDGNHPGAVHAGDGGGRCERPLADQRAGRGRPRARPRLRGRAPALLHADARGGRQVQPHDLAVPRDAGRDRLRARVGRRGGALLPLDRPLRAARLPAQGRQPAHRALLDARPGGRGRPRGRAARQAQPAARRAPAPVRRRR